MKQLIAATVAVGTVLVPATAQAAPIRECGSLHRAVPGSPAGIINLTTRRVSCAPARPFAVAFTRRVTLSKRHYRFRGFSCTVTDLQPEEADIRCVHRARVIHWQIGA